MQDESYQPAIRLRSKADFQRVLDRQCCARGRYLLVHGCENSMGFARLGRIVSKRWGNAVRRNRIRRWIREVFRKTKFLMPSVDLIVMIKNSEIRYSQIESELPFLAKQVAEQLSNR